MYMHSSKSACLKKKKKEEPIIFIPIPVINYRRIKSFPFVHTTFNFVSFDHHVYFFFRTWGKFKTVQANFVNASFRRPYNPKWIYRKDYFVFVFMYIALCIASGVLKWPNPMGRILHTWYIPYTITLRFFWPAGETLYLIDYHNNTSMYRSTLREILGHYVRSIPQKCSSH